jgi:hypothetical protein
VLKTSEDMLDFEQFIKKMPAIEPIAQVPTDYLGPINIIPIDQDERDQVILTIIKILLGSPHPSAGAARAMDWNNGWLENLIEYESTGDIRSLNPKYYGKYQYIRYDSKIWKNGSHDAELNSVRMLMHYIYERFLSGNRDIVELGCGTGHHLYQLASINRSINLYGLDWTDSSQRILKLYQSRNPHDNVIGKNINFFSPPLGNDYIPVGAAIYTFAALEQIGDQHNQIIDFMLASRPKIVVHLEPIEELLDQDQILEYLAVKYFHRRNYLRGFLSALHKRQEKGELKILHECKTGLGSLFIEGYSLVAWTTYT